MIDETLQQLVIYESTFKRVHITNIIIKYAVLERVRTRTQWVSPSPSPDLSPDSDSTLVDSDSDSTQVDSDSQWVQCPGGPLEWQEGVSGSSMDSQKAP